MGCGGSTPQVDERTKAIDNELKAERKKQLMEVKLLLLGAGESGKSTIAKQMKVLHLDGFTDAELAGFRPVLHSNVIEVMQRLVQGTDELGIDMEDDIRGVADEVDELSTVDTKLTPQLASDLQRLWNVPSIQKAYERRSELQLPSSASYLIENMERFAQDGYVPSVEDILRCRARTTGIHEIEFDIEPWHFRMVDVGGQRSERKKWAHCFEDVTAIIFVVAMDGYDMKLYEDENVNRIQEARKLFDDVVNSRWFQATSVVLFLNKSDLFKEKIKTVDLKVCFYDYKGGLDYDAASKFMRHKFKKLNRRTGREIYTHITCATDTKNVEVVFNSVKDSILSSSFRTGGL